MKYEYSFYSDVGGRKNNEDACYAGQSGEDHLFLVADGLGGHECGEIASNLAVSVIKRKFEEAHRSGLAFDAKNAIEEANREILAEQKKSGKAMKTTVALAALLGETVIFAHVGDSRIYAFGKSEIVYQSMDHSASQMAVLAGEITQAQIRHHADRNILTRALGAGERLKVDLTKMPSAEIDALLLCSDGFWEYITEDEMCREKARRDETESAGTGRGKTVDFSGNTPVVSQEKEACTEGRAREWLENMRRIVSANAPHNQDNNTAIAVARERTS